MAAPAIPARDDRSDQLALVLGHDHRIRITAEQGRHRLAGIGRPLCVLRRLGPQLQAARQRQRRCPRAIPAASAHRPRNPDGVSGGFSGRLALVRLTISLYGGGRTASSCARGLMPPPAGRRAAGFLVEWELLMQPLVRRVALGAMQAALAAAGIFVIMLLFSRPAHAATAALPPLTSRKTQHGYVRLPRSARGGRLGHVPGYLDRQLGRSPGRSPRAPALRPSPPPPRRYRSRAPQPRSPALPPRPRPPSPPSAAPVD